MNTKFFNNMASALYSSEYRPLNGFFGVNPNTVSPHTCFIKQNGSMLCLVHLLRLDMTGDKAASFFNYINSQSMDFVNKNNIRNAADIFIFIGKSNEIPQELYTLCQNSSFNDSMDFLCVKWIACTDKNELIVLGNQPNKINGIERLVTYSFAANDHCGRQIIQGIPKKPVFKSNNTFITFFLIAVNAVVFCLMYLYGSGSRDISTLISFGAIEPQLILNYGEYYRLFTSMFLHIGIAHLCSNCLSLYIAGSRVEKYLGKLPYIIIYIASGLCGSLSSVIFSGTVAAGASGAIFGLFGAILAYTYCHRISMQGISLYSIVFLVILNLGNGFLTPGIDNFAHIGGFMGGLVLSAIYLLYERRFKNAE